MRNFRFVFLSVLVWVVALLAVRQFVCIGWVVPIRVASHSMAPTLVGPHYRTTCQKCGHLMFTRADETPGRVEPGVVDCLNCGFRTALTASDTVQVGSRVLIDRWALRKQGIQRFEIVAISTAKDDRQALVTKRVMGLPDEVITLSNGDIYADGAIVQKGSQQFAEMAILVHTDRHRRMDAKPRWRRGGDSAWTVEEDGYRWTRPTAERTDAEEVDWLSYHHRPSSRVVMSHRESAWVHDDYQFNQGVSRALHRVDDLALSAELQWTGAGTLHVRCPSPWGTCEIRFHATKPGELKSVELWVDAALVARASDQTALLTWRSDAQLLVGYWDRQLICRLGGLEVLRHRFQRPPAASQTNLRQGSSFALAASDLEELVVTDLRIWRDLYYFMPDDLTLSRGAVVGTARRRPHAPLPPDSYLLLGDNVPQSRDARYGDELGVIPGSQILGFVAPVN